MTAPATPTPPQYTAGWVKQDNANLAPPANLGVSPVATGGTLPDGATYWVLTALSPQGETTASNEVTATLTGGGMSSASFTWDAVTSAASYSLYRGTAPGGEDVLVASGITGTTATDDGSSSTAGSPPTTNTALSGTMASATRTNIVTSNYFKDWGVMTIDHGGHYATWDEVQNWGDLS